MSTWLTVFSATCPWTFCLLFCSMALCAVAMLANFGFKCWNRWLKSRNIKHHGWLPSHLDADDDLFHTIPG